MNGRVSSRRKQLRNFKSKIALFAVISMVVLGSEISATKARDEIHYIQTKVAMTTEFLFDEIDADEGVKLKPYKDRLGNWTIAIGHNMQVDPPMLKRLVELQRNGITMDEARTIFKADVAKAESDLDDALPWWRQLSDGRQNGIVNLTFNMGVNGLVHGWPNFLADVKAGNYKSAADRIRNSKHYISQVHGRAARIADQIETGERNPIKPVVIAAN